MYILGIETSCDETSAAIVEKTSGGLKLISQVTATSQEIHAQTGGIIPENAARQQIKTITPVIEKALKEAFPKTKHEQFNTKIDAIAVTQGPGLIGSLLVGIETARTLAHLWQKPLIPINHLVGHIYANWLNKRTEDFPKFPALCLIVSGGHTDLLLMKNHPSKKAFQYLGGTRDDAAGEAFDKTARLLGLPYPGGPAIAKAAADFRKKNPNFKLDLFPRPMINSDNYDFSFSGLKTAVLNFTKKEKKLDQKRLAAEIEEAIVDVLATKTKRAFEKYKPQSLLLSGGVAANQKLRISLRGSLGESPELFHVPPTAFCTDNAAMIAAAACFNLKEIDWEEISPNPNLHF